jgi:hypothetical protein
LVSCVNIGKRDFADLQNVSAFGTAAYVAWIVGSGTAYLTTNMATTLTTIPAVDGLLAAFIVHSPLAKITA